MIRLSERVCVCVCVCALSQTLKQAIQLATRMIDDKEAEYDYRLS